MLLGALAIARRRGAPIVLAVVGDGELRGELERTAAELGCADAVRWVGYRRDLVDIVASTDVAVLTSDNEGTPVWLIEAGAGGRPLVATRVGGVPDVVAPGTGRLAAPGDAESVADALVGVAKNAPERRQMGAAARAHVGGRYRSEALLQRMAGIYEDLLASRRAAAGQATAGTGAATPLTPHE